MPEAQSADDFPVFVSYNSQERNSVWPIVQALEQRTALRIWFEAPPGSRWEDATADALQQARVALVFLGPHGWGPSHLLQAQEISKQVAATTAFHVIPILLPGARADDLFKVPQLFQTRMRVEFRSLPDEENLERLAARLRELVPLPPSEALPPASSFPAPDWHQVKPAPSPRERIEIARKALTDKETETDLLGFKDYADAIAEIIQSPQTEKPLTIAIDGAWGMGKTSLMRMIRARLEPKYQREAGAPTMRTVWFNAWKYDQEESLWAALVLEILAQVRERCGPWRRLELGLELNLKRMDWGRLLGSFLKRLVLTLALALLGVFLVQLWPEGETLFPGGKALIAKYTGGGLGILGVLGSLFLFGRELSKSIKNPFELKVSEYLRTPDYQQKIGFMAEFEKDFERVIDVVTEKGKWPLVVFIDDLDRCEPPKPVEIIEAINLLLDARYCIFIIGMDSQSVAGSIETKYKDLKEHLGAGDDPGALPLGQRFLEKIIQLHFLIPRADDDTLRTFVEETLGRHAAPQPAPIPPEVVEVEQSIKAEQRAGKSLDEAVATVRRKKGKKSDDDVHKAAAEAKKKERVENEATATALAAAVPYLGYNPRKIKRFINVFRLVALIANSRKLLESGRVQLDTLVTCLLMTTRWPDLAPRLLANERDLRGRLESARNLRTSILQGTLKGLELQSAQETLSNLMEDPFIRRYVDVDPLFKLMDSLTRLSREELERYAQLSRTVKAQAPEETPSP